MQGTVLIQELFGGVNEGLPCGGIRLGPAGGGISPPRSFMTASSRFSHHPGRGRTHGVEGDAAGPVVGVMALRAVGLQHVPVALEGGRVRLLLRR